MGSERVRGSRARFTKLDALGRPVGHPVMVEGEFDVVVEYGADEVVGPVCLCPSVGVHRYADGAWSVTLEVMHSRHCGVSGSVGGVSPGAPLNFMPPGASSCPEPDDE